MRIFFRKREAYQVDNPTCQNHKPCRYLVGIPFVILLAAVLVYLLYHDDDPPDAVPDPTDHPPLPLGETTEDPSVGTGMGSPSMSPTENLVRSVYLAATTLAPAWIAAAPIAQPPVADRAVSSQPSTATPAWWDEPTAQPAHSTTMVPSDAPSFPPNSDAPHRSATHATTPGAHQTTHPPQDAGFVTAAITQAPAHFAPTPDRIDSSAPSSRQTSYTPHVTTSRPVHSSGESTTSIPNSATNLPTQHTQNPSETATTVVPQSALTSSLAPSHRPAAVEPTLPPSEPVPTTPIPTIRPQQLVHCDFPEGLTSSTGWFRATCTVNQQHPDIAGKLFYPTLLLSFRECDFFGSTSPGQWTTPLVTSQRAPLLNNTEGASPVTRRCCDGTSWTIWNNEPFWILIATPAYRGNHTMRVGVGVYLVTPVGVAEATRSGCATFGMYCGDGSVCPDEQPEGYQECPPDPRCLN